MTNDPMITICVEDDDGCEVEHVIPAIWGVCDRCGGRGVHDHEAFSNGLTAADFDEDPDFREEYMAGRYDVQCASCNGLRVVPVIDDARVARDEEYARLVDVYDEYTMSVYAGELEAAAERRMGA